MKSGYHHTNIHPDKGEEMGQSDWHLDKKVTVSLIVIGLSNLVATVWWAAVLTTKVESNAIAKNAIPSIMERVIKLEAMSEEQGRILARVGITLDKLDNTLYTVATEQQRRTEIIERAKKLLDK